MLNDIDTQSNKAKSAYNTNFSYYIDTTNQLAYSDIKKIKNDFSPVDANKIPYELSTQRYWIQIDVKNLTNHHIELVLYADNSLLNVLSVYHHNEKSNLLNEVTQIQQVYPHKNFGLSAKSSQNFIVEIQTSGPPNVPLIILTKSAFEQRIFYAQIIYGIFIGVILLMVMYNLVLFFAIKDKVYLNYIGYLLTAFFVLSSLTGFGYLLFPPSLQMIINTNLLFIDYYLVVFLLSFTLFFLRYDQKNNRTYKIGQVFCLALIVCSFYSLTLNLIEQTKLFFSIQPIVYLFAIFIIIKRLRSDFSWAKYYVLSWFPLLIGAAIQPLVLLNYLEYSFLSRNAFLFAVIVEVTLMAFALAERMKRNELDRITDIAYHITSGLPRKSNIESFINRLSRNHDNDFCVVIIKPEHIEKVAMYINDRMNTELFQHLFKKLTSLFEFNDAIYPLTSKQEKLCFINNNSLAIVINNRTNKQPIPVIIQSIQQVVSESFKISTVELPLSAVVGIARFPEHGVKGHQLINHAVIATSQAEQDHNKWAMFENESSDKTTYLLKLAGDLTAAIQRKQLSIYHQPQIDLKTLRVCSSECLIRWNHPEEGFIPPDVFIPIAEDMGLINQLTLWVIEQSLYQQHTLLHEFEYNHMVSINISGKDISSKNFFRQTLDIIDNSNIPADKIIFELTESASFAYNQHALTLIEKLVELGITISIDDFGTGYSTMSQISHLPVQELKVDREFVENVNDDQKRQIIAETTVKMAKGLGLEVVAEGINSQADEDTLRNFGCDIGQGYFYAKPMPLDDYLTWLENLDNGRIKQPVQGEFIPAKKS